VELREYGRILRRHWLLMFLATAIGAAAAVGVTAASSKIYKAKATAFVSTSPSIGGKTGSSLADSSKFGLDRVKSYVELADSELVLQPVIDGLGLPLTVSTLAREVSAQNPTDTLLLDIVVSDGDPARAARIANAVATQLGVVIETLETPRAGTTAPVKVTVTRPAVRPHSAAAPRPTLNLALGIILGLAVGFALSMLREMGSKTIQGPEDVRAITGSSPLGSVANSAEFAKSPLVALTARTVNAESYRTIRTRLQLVDVDHPPRCIVVTSAVPGEGKTVSAANLAITLASAGARVCLVEADMRRPRLHTYLGLEGSVGLSNVLAEQHKLDDLLVDWHNHLLTVLGAGTAPPDPSELLGSQHMRDLLSTLRSRFDYVVIDSPPLLPVTDAAVLAQQVDGAVLIVRHGHTHHEQLQRAVETLRQANARLLGTAITFAPASKPYYSYGYQEYLGSKRAARFRSKAQRGVSNTPVPVPTDDSGSTGAVPPSDLALSVQPATSRMTSVVRRNAQTHPLRVSRQLRARTAIVAPRAGTDEPRPRQPPRQTVEDHRNGSRH
jgi:tyrosine-protein kinase